MDACMKALGKGSDDIAGSALSADWKLAIACRLKSETSVSNAWLGERLNMGGPRSVSAICGRYVKQAIAKCSYHKKLSKLIIDY